MKPIKKFSAILESDKSVLESLTKTYGSGVLDLVKKLGYDSIEEIAKEKKLLTKLESLLKDLPKKSDVSEDEAEEIEDEVVKMGEPKSLEGEEETSETGDDEVAEEEHGTEIEKEEGDGEKSAEEIEDEIVKMGEPDEQPESEGEEKVSDDQEVTKEVPAEADEVEDEDGVPKAEEEVETPKATRRIKTFEDFIDEKEVTVNKNIKYHDDDEEPEDYAVPVAASADPLSEEDDEYEGEEDEMKGDEMEDMGDKKVDHEDDAEKEDHYKGAVKSDDEEIDALKKDVEYDEEEEKKDEGNILNFDSFIAERYNKVIEEVGKDEMEAKAETIEDEVKDEEAGAAGEAIPVEKGDGSESAAGIAATTMEKGKPKEEPESKGEEFVTKDQEVTEEPETAKDEAGTEEGGKIVVKESKIEEKEITSDKEFEEYAMEILKAAHGDDFDEAKAKEVVDGLKSKYKEDYGAMVGALQSSMG
jgi:hypothetical protein